MRLFCIILLMSILIGFQAAGQVSDRQKAAESALENLYGMVNKENYMIFGFDSPDDIENMDIEIPFQNYIIRLDHLQRYSDENIQDLLVGGNSYTYPVISDSQVKSSILLVLHGSEWKAVSFGGPNYIKKITDIRIDLVETTKLPQDSFFSVRILALNIYCLAFYNESDVLMLSPLHDLDDFDLPAGSIVKATELIGLLLPEVNNHDGLPR